MSKTADLLEEIAALKAMLIAADALDKRKDERIARLEKLVAAFKQAVFGRKSEKSDPDQFELALEDLETAMATIHAEEDAEDRAAKRPAKPRAANRGSLPKHLPRIEELIEPHSLICACGGCLHCIGEDVSERLDIVPAQFRVIVTRRPKYACRSCTDGVAQAAAPARLIPGGMPTEATVAHVLVSKYADHLPLYRQAQIYSRQGVDLDRSIRPIALNRKNALFAGHDAGAANWAVIASLIETCKMNGVDPHAWLSATLTVIVKSHKQSQIHDLLPWNYAVTV